MATHGVLSGPAIDRLKNSEIERLVITNTLPLPPEKQFDKIEVLSVAPIIAAALDAVFEDTSVSRDLRRREPGLMARSSALRLVLARLRLVAGAPSPRSWRRVRCAMLTRRLAGRPLRGRCSLPLSKERRHAC